MRLMITGAGGMTGAEVVRQSETSGIECAAFTRGDLDISDAEAVFAAVRKSAPDIVVNAAAYTAVDQAESDEEQATLVNGYGAGNVARAAAMTGAGVIHISTDYVFDGMSSEPYLPSDRTNPLGAYGRSKLAGENAVRSASERHMIVRTSWVYSHEGRNFVRTMLRLASSGTELRVVDDQHGSPTSAADLAGALIRAAEAMCSTPSLNGTYHFTNSGMTTWYDFATAIFELRGGSVPVIRPVSTAEYPTPAKRPLWSLLDCTSFERNVGITARPWRTALRQTLDCIQ